MTIQKTIRQVSGGANLMKPEFSIAYLAAATVSVVVILMVWKAGNFVFAKGSRLVQGSVPGVSTPDFAAALGIE